MRKLKIITIEAVEGHEDAELDWLGDLSKWEFFEDEERHELHAVWIGPPEEREDNDRELVWYNSERYWGVVS